jgi:predicted nucleic acid-binding protein
VNDHHYLLDTSALLTFIEDEAGAEQVEALLRRHDTQIPWLALLETYTITFQERGEAEADRRYALIQQLPVKLLWNMDEPTLLTAGRIKAKYRVSFADAIIASFAVQQHAILLHKDPEFEALQDQVFLEALPYQK